ncbi:MAG: hydroxyacylglutathione hydrolase [Proteobacteria bacterium]|nr:hydroxyacylglutathione hydrolase [Pseudomonadota bacterium]
MVVYPVKAFTDNYIWTIVDEDNKKAYCIDPGEALPLLTFLKSRDLILEAILLTHHHSDHIGGVEELLYTNSELRIFGPENLSFPLMQVVNDNSSIKLGTYEFKVIETPGHTATHISFFEVNQLWLFCGDTLFSAGCGRVFDGTMEQLYHSLQKIMTLPLETKIFCAHEYTRQNLRFATLVEPDNLEISEYYLELANNGLCSLPSSLEREMKINPFLRITHLQTLSEELNEQSLIHIFRELRKQKDEFR